MTLRLRMLCIVFVPIFLPACVNYRTGNDIHDPTVKQAKLGKDCEPTFWGLGFEPTIRDALKHGGITKTGAMHDTNTSVFGIGRYCHIVEGE
jgi:hypothetical protein